MKKAGRSVLALVAAATVLFSGYAAKVSAEDGFTTNLTGWNGVEAAWTVGADGYQDDPSQDLMDFSLADASVDGTKSFVYEVQAERISGYGFGLVLGVKDPSSRESIQNNFVLFMVDPGSIYYNVNNNGPVGRPLGDGEKCPRVEDSGAAPRLYTFRVVYDADTGAAEFYLGDQLIQTLPNAASTVSGRVGLLAHGGRVMVKKAALTVSEEANGFVTNVEGWTGVESTWRTTANGYRDGTEQRLWDFAVPNVTLDGTKSFVYEAQMERINGYGFGVVFGIQDASSLAKLQEKFSYFMLDDANVYFNIDNTGNQARPLTDDEKCPRVSDPNAAPRLYTFRIEYDAETTMLRFYLGNSLLGSCENAAAYASGKLGLFARDAEIYVKKALLTISGESAFASNLTGWTGVESTWAQRELGYCDGPEQTVNDFAVAAETVDGGQSFVYEIEIQRTNHAGYGFGLILGVKDSSSRAAIQADYLSFLVDPSNAYYRVDGENPIGRPLTEEEKCPLSAAEGGTAKVYTMKAQYDAAAKMIEFYLNGSLVAAYALPDDASVAGKLGIIAHDSSVLVTKANLTYVEDNTETGDRDGLFLCLALCVCAAAGIVFRRRAGYEQ